MGVRQKGRWGEGLGGEEGTQMENVLENTGMLVWGKTEERMTKSWYKKNKDYYIAPSKSVTIQLEINLKEQVNFGA